MNMEELAKDKKPSIEDDPILNEYEYVFGEFLRFPLKRDIYFSIELMLGVAPVSKTPYIMST
jgi:hypothetical protein